MRGGNKMLGSAVYFPGNAVITSKIYFLLILRTDVKSLVKIQSLQGKYFIFLYMQKIWK